jgi:hypothetical protein
MEDRLQKIFDSVPADEPRSRLEPYRELILRWRRQGRTYHRIRQLLIEQCDVKVAYVTLYRFIQRRSRPKTDPPPEAQLAIIMPVVADEKSPLRSSRPSPEEIAAMREAARASNHKPVFMREEPPELFVYDPDKPLTNKPS